MKRACRSSLRAYARSATRVTRDGRISTLCRRHVAMSQPSAISTWKMQRQRVITCVVWKGDWLIGQETLGRINLYLLPGYEPAQMPALGDFLRDQDPKDLLICPLLDWRTPWAWIRQLSFMIRHLTTLLDDIRRASPERDLQYTNLTNSLEMRQRTFTEQKENDGLSRFHNDPASALPLEAGELDRPLGVPLLCIAQNVRVHAKFSNQITWH